jgi:glutathione S-transferase
MPRAEKLYVCWGTFQVPGMRSHPCKNAYEALRAAGHDPEVVKVYSAGALPDITPGRREVKRLTGQSWVPVLVTDEGEAIHEAEAIIAWAQEHSAATPAPAAP